MPALIMLINWNGLSKLLANKFSIDLLSVLQPQTDKTQS
jgi:hypothetical protein